MPARIQEALTIAVHTIPAGPPLNENTFLLVASEPRALVLIDPGADPETISRTIHDVGGDLAAILLTHAHHDHLFSAGEISRRWGVPVRLHRSDEKLLRYAPLYAWTFGGRRLDPLENVETFDGTRPLELSGMRIEVIETPGHTPGGVCYAIGSAIFTGDTLLRESIGRTDLPGGDRGALDDSVDRILRHPNLNMIYPGHGAAWTVREAVSWWAERRTSRMEERP